MIISLLEKKAPAESHHLSPAKSVRVTPKPFSGDPDLVAFTDSRGNPNGAAAWKFLTI